MEIIQSKFEEKTYTLQIYMTKTAITKANRTNRAPNTITSNSPPLVFCELQFPPTLAPSICPTLWGKCTVTGTEVCREGLPLSVAIAVKCTGVAGIGFGNGERRRISPNELMVNILEFGPTIYHE